MGVYNHIYVYMYIYICICIHMYMDKCVCVCVPSFLNVCDARAYHIQIPHFNGSAAVTGVPPPTSAAGELDAGRIQCCPGSQ